MSQTLGFAGCGALPAKEHRRDGGSCDVCGDPVPPKAGAGGPRKKYCSDACRRVAWERKHPGRRGWQAALPGESRVERAFARWIETEDGQVVKGEVVWRARALVAHGVSRYGIAGLWEAIRYDNALALHGEAGAWKLNNSHRALLARMLMNEHPELAGFFEVRDLRGRP